MGASKLKFIFSNDFCIILESDAIEVGTIATRPQQLGLYMDSVSIISHIHQ